MNEKKFQVSRCLSVHRIQRGEPLQKGAASKKPDIPRYLLQLPLFEGRTLSASSGPKGSVRIGKRLLLLGGVMRTVPSRDMALRIF